MKTINFIAICLFGTFTAFAQDLQQNQVPSIVANSFKKEFPKASDVEWEQQGEQFEVEFEIGFFNDFKAWFDASGQLIKYSEEISISKLPDAVKATIKSQFPGYRLEDIKKFIENDIETYQVEIEKGNDEKKLLFSKNGQII